LHQKNRLYRNQPQRRNMELKFQESGMSYWLTLKPEDFKESNELMRMTTQSKREPAYISFDYSGDEPVCFISFRRKNSDKRETSIKNGKHG